MQILRFTAEFPVDVDFLIVSEKHFDLDYYGGSGLQVTADVENGNGILKARSYTTWRMRTGRKRRFIWT